MARRKEKKERRTEEKEVYAREGREGAREDGKEAEEPARKRQLSPAERNNARVLNTVDDGNCNFVVEARTGGGGGNKVTRSLLDITRQGSESGGGFH